MKLVKFLSIFFTLCGKFVYYNIFMKKAYCTFICDILFYIENSKKSTDVDDIITFKKF